MSRQWSHAACPEQRADMPRPGPSNFVAFRRPLGAQALADLVAPSLGPVLTRQGFSEADVLMHWADIVGADLAVHCQPLKLQWRGRAAASDLQVRTPPATLVVRVEGAFAVRLQHMAAVVLERVNTHLGWACVGKLVFRQGPLPRPTPPRRPSPIDPAAQRRAAESTMAVGDEALRTALTRLGSRVLSSSTRSASGAGEK